MLKCIRSVYVHKILRKCGKLWFLSHRIKVRFLLPAFGVYRTNSSSFFCSEKTEREICENSNKQSIPNLYRVFTQHLVLRSVFHSIRLCHAFACLYCAENKLERTCEGHTSAEESDCEIDIFGFISLFCSRFLFHFFVHLKPYVFILLCVSPTLSFSFLFVFVFDSVFLLKWIEDRIHILETPARAHHFKNVYSRYRESRFETLAFTHAFNFRKFPSKNRIGMCMCKQSEMRTLLFWGRLI